jgi:hypothetical protein
MNRPERMNSLTSDLLSMLAAKLREVADDSSVRVVVLTGAGDRAFSAGADLAPPDAPSPADRHASGRQTLEESFDGLKRMQESSWILHSMPKPTIAAINGAVAGASPDVDGLRLRGGRRSDLRDGIRAHRLLGRLRRQLVRDEAARQREGARAVSAR